MSEQTTVLVADDDRNNVEIMRAYLEGAGYRVLSALDGRQTLSRLVMHPEIDLVLLDRLMPDMNGLEVLKRIKSDSRRRDLPVIMQSGLGAIENVREGIQAGAFYYLTKPFDEPTLLNIVESACADLRAMREVRETVANQQQLLSLMEAGRFHFRTLEQAKNLAHAVANRCPEPSRVVFGLQELMINAVEHGNLGITYAEKTALVRTGTWHKEVQRRLELPENREKFATVEFETRLRDIVIVVRDQGLGFSWKDYLEISPTRAGDPNGRGVALARAMSFTSLQFVGAGNEVICTINTSLAVAPEDEITFS